MASCSGSVIIIILHHSNSIDNGYTNYPTINNTSYNPSIPITFSGGLNGDGVVLITDFGVNVNNIILPDLGITGFDVNLLPKYIITDDIVYTPDYFPPNTFLLNYLTLTPGTLTHPEELTYLVYNARSNGNVLYDPIVADVAPYIQFHDWEFGTYCKFPQTTTTTTTTTTQEPTYGDCSPCFPYIPTTPYRNPPFKLDKSITSIPILLSSEIVYDDSRFSSIKTTTTTPTTTTLPPKLPPIITPPIQIYDDCVNNCKKLKF
jgi:hypothetical protein